MITSKLYEVIRILIWIAIPLGMYATEASQTHSVHMCKSHNNRQYNLNAVKCETDYVVTITCLYYANRPCPKCHNCCQRIHGGSKENGSRLIEVKKACNGKQMCTLTSRIVMSSNGLWRATIGYMCNPPRTTSQKTISTATLSTVTANPTSTTRTTPKIATTKITTTETSPTLTKQATPTISVYVAPGATSTSKTTVEEAMNGETKEQTHGDDLTISIVVSVLVSLIAVGLVVCIVVCYLRKRGHRSDKPGDVSNDIGNNNSNIMAMGNRAYVDDSVEEDNSYAYILSESDSGYKETSAFYTSNNVHASNTATVNVQNNNNYAHVSRQPPAIDNTYSHITNKQSAKNNEDANYSHIAGVHGLNNVEVIRVDASNTDDITNTFCPKSDKTPMDKSMFPNINDNGDEYNHTHVLRSSDKKLGLVTEKCDDDDYNHANFARTNTANTAFENEDEYNHTNFARTNIANTAFGDKDEYNHTNFARTNIANTAFGDKDEYNHANFADTALKFITIDKTIANDYEQVSTIDNTSMLRENSNIEIRRAGNNDDRNNTYS